MKDTQKLKKSHLNDYEKLVGAARGVFEEIASYIAETGEDLVAVETELFRQVLALGRALFQSMVSLREAEEARERESGPSRLGYQGQRSYRYVSVFGEIEVSRAYYWDGEKGCAPLDGEMSRPKRSYSSLLTQWAMRLAVVQPFEASGDWLAEQLGIRIPKRMIEEMSREAAVDARAFYEGRESVAECGDCLAISGDGKGVPMTKEELAAAPARRGRGEKAQKKKMATVVTMFRVTGEARSAAGGKLPDIAARDKQIWGELKDKAKFPAFLRTQVARRSVDAPRLVYLADGQPAMWTLKNEICPDAIEVLDFYHLSEYLWKAAYCLHAEGSPEATAWVNQQQGRMLSGQAGLVIGGLRHRLTKGLIRGAARRETVATVINYLVNNRSRTRYDEYLKAGFPIGSGAVESACKQLIVTRMEGAGMRWSVPGAQAMLDLRAIHLNGDWNDYWDFHRRRDHARRYPDFANHDSSQTSEKLAA
jgi:hypothetical protein